MRYYFLPLVIMFICFSQSSKTQVNKCKRILSDTVEIIKIITDTNVIFQYKYKGIVDSTKTYFKNKSLSSVYFHNPKDSIMSKEYFVTGQLKAVLLNKEKIKGTVFHYTFFKNGKTEFIEIAKDSSIIYNGDTCKCLSLLINYFDNGMVKEKGCQGLFNGTGLPVGHWFGYDKSGNVESKTYYHNDKFGKDFILKEFFYLNGKPKSVEKYNNYILYETVKKPKGIRLFYNLKGNLIKSFDYDKIVNR